MSRLLSPLQVPSITDCDYVRYATETSAMQAVVSGEQGKANKRSQSESGSDYFNGYNSPSSYGDANAKRRFRTNFTESQSTMLEEAFKASHYPDQQTKRSMAESLCIPEDRVTVWFQNRRAKWRRKEVREKEKKSVPATVPVETPPPTVVTPSLLPSIISTPNPYSPFQPPIVPPVLPPVPQYFHSPMFTNEYAFASSESHLHFLDYSL